MKRVRDKGERSQLRAEVRELRRELAGREEASMKQALSGVDVMLATNTGELQMHCRPHLTSTLSYMQAMRLDIIRNHLL